MIGYSLLAIFHAGPIGDFVSWPGSDRRLVRPALRGTLLGKETGTSRTILPVVVGRFRATPHIVLSGTFLALSAPDYRLASSMGFGTTVRLGPWKNLRALRVTCLERAALLRLRVPRRAVLP